MKLPRQASFGVFASVLGLAAACAQTKSAPAAAPIELFNGKNLDGWSYVASGQPADIREVCQVKDGVLAVTGVPGKATGYIELTAVRENYRLHVEWRWATPSVTASTNS